MKHFRRSTIVRSAFVASLAIAAGIGSLCAPEHAWSTQINDQTDPQILIQTVTQQILDEVRKQALTPDDIPRIMIIVNRDILPYVDIRRTTQYAMGRFWRTATLEQQDQVIEQFKHASSVPSMAVPYRSIGQAFTDAVGGQIQVIIPGLAAAMPHVR